jgi:hypothetical protein
MLLPLAALHNLNPLSSVLKDPYSLWTCKQNMTQSRIWKPYFLIKFIELNQEFTKKALIELIIKILKFLKLSINNCWLSKFEIIFPIEQFLINNDLMIKKNNKMPRIENLTKNPTKWLTLKGRLWIRGGIQGSDKFSNASHINLKDILMQMSSDH